MSGSKHFDRIAWAVTALVLVVTILFMNGGSLGLQAMTHIMGYENRLFDNTRVHTIDIVMDDWDELIENAMSEEYYAANAVIDGESYKNIGIRAKGNTSLSTVASLDSERYSFKIEFDQYDSSITYHGLDKLSLNNLIQDSTMMKDYLTYTMMNEFGMAAPLCSFVYITVNGEDWGLYLAVEGVEESFLERNYGSDYGELYKPDSMSFGGDRGNGKNFDRDAFETRGESAEDTSQTAPKTDMTQMLDMENFNPAEQLEGQLPENFDASDLPEDFVPSERPEGEKGGGFGFGMGSSDVKLQYIDDEPDSYSNIWNNAKTEITEADQKRLIASLEKLSNGEEIASVVDIEQVIRYFVVHNYVCNDDSYTGMMVHNYYLYEKDGQMAMIPWDYNLAFGTFTASDADSTVNTPIDNPVSGGSGEDRPMWNWILSNESYTELYHQYFTEFLNAVDIQGIIDNTYNLIQSYVEKDPTAFYTDEEFETGVDTLRQFCSLRSQSISTQLETGETTENMGYTDASSISLTDMGAMNGGMGKEGNEKFQMPGMPSSVPSRQDAEGKSSADEATQSESAGETSGQTAQEGRENASEDSKPVSSERAQEQSLSPNKIQMPEGFQPGQNGTDNAAASGSAWIWLTASALVLGIGLVTAKFFRSR